MTTLRILAFEPFDTGSHRAVRESISRRSRHAWRWVTRPGRAWKWRMRLAALEMVAEAAQSGLLDEPVDVIFATSLLSSADLRAALPARLRGVPLVLCMHENQAAYPAGHRVDERDMHFALTNLASVMTADRVIWNSAWNRDSFIAGATELLRHAPDARLGAWQDEVMCRSVVLWPPVEPPPGERPAPPAARPAKRRALRVVWPHRWEHDKGPDELLGLALCHSEALDLRWVILGERFAQAPPAFDELRRRLGDRIEHIGYELDRAAYWQRLLAADWVLSTARHEFFGIAVVEALLAGCLPWLPQRLSYPELLPPQAHGLSPMSPPDDPAAIGAAIRAHLEPALAPNAVARLDDVLEGMM